MEKNKKQALIFSIVGVLTLITLVAGATYAYFKARSFKHTGDYCYAEARMVYICVARDADYIGRVPAALKHFFFIQRKKRHNFDSPYLIE